jgi:hypothetical protein
VPTDRTFILKQLNINVSTLRSPPQPLYDHVSVYRDEAGLIGGCGSESVVHVSPPQRGLTVIPFEPGVAIGPGEKLVFWTPLEAEMSGDVFAEGFWLK